MNRHRVSNIMRKEWQVLSGDTSTLLLLTLLPLLILAEAMVAIWLIAKFGGEAMAANAFFQGALGKLLSAISSAQTLPDIDQVRLLLLSQFNLFLLLIPTMIAIYFATYSIVEEKLSQSLEPLLATPVRTGELLLGKALAGAIPALLVTWACAAICVGVVSTIGWAYLLPYVLTANWFLNLLFLTPLIAILSFLLGVIGSSRAKDFRNAQNLAFFIILPVFGLIAIQITGVVWFTPLLTAGLGIAICLIDIVVLRIAVRLFHRESIVVKWR